MSALPADAPDPADRRALGLLGATGVGVGAIVGGGVLALAGVAFGTTGPSAILAFALNGLIALLTALTFAEMATSFPESGGTYTFAKKVLPIETAFMVGWVVWFASIVAAVLYALGFAAFFQIVLDELWSAVRGSAAPPWIRGHPLAVALAVVATILYALRLARRPGGGGQWETVGKVVLFTALICAGLWALLHRQPAALRDQLTPFFAAGGAGLLQAMGYTFIALQGFDLIAAVGGEVRRPRRNLPRAILGSLGIALLIYLPLLFVVATVGVPPGGSITEVAAADPEAVIAVAVERYLGRAGFWLVIAAAVLSMLSALQANLLAASHIALAMARDRNLPGRLRQLHRRWGTPLAAVVTTAGMVAAILLAIPDVATAGAMSSLIFLLSFALAHWTGILARRRGGGERRGFQIPLFPLVPLVGGLACVTLALFQGLSVPAAGAIGALWLAVGGLLYALVFSRRARVADAAAEALDPQLTRLRGRDPLVLVPIANPASAEGLVTLASALAPPRVGRVLLLYVVHTPTGPTGGEPPPQLIDAERVLGRALAAAFAAELQPEALTTFATDPWREITRVARSYRCASLLLGLGEVEAEASAHPGLLFSWLAAEVTSDVVLLRAPQGWRLGQVRRVLVPVGGRRDQSHLRARLIGSLCRTYPLEVTYLGVAVTAGDCRGTLEREVRDLAEDEAPGRSRVDIRLRDDVAEALIEAARDHDLVILGLRREGGGRGLGEVPRRVVRESACAVLIIGQRR